MQYHGLFPSIPNAERSESRRYGAEHYDIVRGMGRPVSGFLNGAAGRSANRTAHRAAGMAKHRNHPYHLFFGGRLFGADEAADAAEAALFRHPFDDR